ncbi:unnamed protein product [Orchesella dallaii]|uniref:PAP-associated domain-containing protein n=1 Tax=Orchesella dallaii TaxID=48710 RepID=A0ABP1S038_9HEXA
MKSKYGKHLTDIHANLEEFPPVQNGSIGNLFVGIPHIIKTTVTDQSFKFRQDFLCAKTYLVFSMVSVPAALFPEIQACRLVAYYCSFDSRIKPLITVIRYWAKINGIQLANSNDVSHKRAPDPAALDWLVVFFLCHKMKILPTPREVTERPHPKFSWSNFDIGFSFDLNFAKTFSDRYKEPTKERHSLNTFHLAIKFFKFYSKELRLVTGRKITLNTRDGEIIETKEFGGYLRDIPSKLPLEERQMAKKGKNIGIVAEMAINLLHPLYPAHGFSICDKNFVKTVCPAMERTGKKLKRALDFYKKGQQFDIKLVLQVIL